MAFDMEPATNRLSDLIRNVRDGQLDAPTPCSDMNLGELLDHVQSFAFAFRAAAEKHGTDDRPPPPDASRLGDDWRERIPRDIEALAAAWRDPAAWEGMTKAGGLDLPGELAGVIALDEAVLHGWDIAQASDQAFDVEPDLLDAVHGFVTQFSGGGAELRAGLFGPEVKVSGDAPLLDRVLGMAGRDPGVDGAAILTTGGGTPPVRHCGRDV